MTLITIEGLDGAGKSTLAAELAQRLRGPDGGGVELLREPGGVALAERIRELVKDPRLEVAPRTEALLYAAARAQLVYELLEPLLAAGAVVVLDRFIDSSLAYQGAARGVGLEAVRAINAFGAGDVSPDRTLLLRIDPATGRARQQGRIHEPDRLEREDEAFFAMVAAAYDEIAAAEPQRVRVIDAALSPEAVLAQALDALDGLGLVARSPH